MAKASGKALSISEQIRVIKEVYPDISDNGIKAFLANIDLESGGKIVMENSYEHEQVFRKYKKDGVTKNGVAYKKGEYVQNIPTMRQNLTDLGFGENASPEKIKEYNSYNNQERLGIMYQGDKDTPGGGVGLLQLTTANYGGNKEKTKNLLEMGVDYKKFLNDPAYNLKATLEYYKKYDPKFTPDQVNDISTEALGKKINPFRKKTTANFDIFSKKAEKEFNNFLASSEKERKKEIENQNEIESDDKSRVLKGSDESEQTPENIVVDNKSLLDNVYRVYDDELEKYTKFQSTYDPNSKTWSHKALDNTEFYTQDNIDEIGNMYNTLGGDTPDGGNSYFREEEFADGQKFYKAFASESGNEQTEFQKRFSFVDNKPAQLATDPKVVAKYSEIESQKQQEESTLSLREAEKEREKEKDPVLVDLEKAVSDAERVVTAQDNGTNRFKLKEAQEKLQKYNQKLQSEQKPKQLEKLVSVEKALRKQLAEMQENPQLFSVEEIKKTQAQIDKVAINIANVQGAPRETGPFGNTAQQVQNVSITQDDLDVKTIGDGDEVELPEDLLADVKTTDIQTVPGEYVEEVKPTTLDEVVVSEEEEEIIDEDELNSKNSAVLKGLERFTGGAAGIVSGLLGASAMRKATKPLEKDELPQLSEAFLDYLEQNRELSKQGFTPAEEAQQMQNINASYRLGVENLIRGTAGDRAKFLAMSGQVDANRSRALLDFAAKDAQMNRVNLQNYGKVLTYKENHDIKNSLTKRTENINEQLKNKASAAEFASEAFGNMMDEIQYQRQYGPGSLNHLIKERRLIDLYGVDGNGNVVDDGILLTDEEQELKNKNKNLLKENEALENNGGDVDKANEELQNEKEITLLDTEIQNNNAEDYAFNDGDNSLLTTINRTT